MTDERRLRISDLTETRFVVVPADDPVHDQECRLLYVNRTGRGPRYYSSHYPFGDFCILGMILDGQCQMGDAVYRAGYLYFRTPETACLQHSIDTAGYTLYDIGVTTKGISARFKNLPHSLKEGYAIARDSAAIVTLFERMLQTAEQGGRHAAAICYGYLDVLIHTIAREVDPAEQETCIPALLRDTLAQAKASPEEYPTAQLLAKHAGISVTHLNRLFRKHLHETPHAWLRKLRINRAMEMLLNEDSSIGEVADSCGFSSPYSFSRTFSKQVGLNPSEFKARRGR